MFLLQKQANMNKFFRVALRKIHQNMCFIFWVSSRVWTEYENIRAVALTFLDSVQMWKHMDQRKLIFWCVLSSVGK